MKTQQKRGVNLEYGYFYEGQSTQFSFYRTPKVLFTDARYDTLPHAAKTLYGILLDRVSLSQKNKWFDEYHRIYIYMTNKSICDALRITDKTATKLLVALEKYHLIERKRQGQGKPTRIYVKNFVESDYLPFLNRNNYESGIVENTVLDSEKIRCNKNEINDTNKNDNNLILSNEKIDMDEKLNYRTYFMRVLDIDELKKTYPYKAAIISELLELIIDIVCTSKKSIAIAGERRSIDIVRNRFMQLKSEHIEYILESISANNTKINNIKQYLLAALYNAPLTINNYYQSLVSHDMAAGDFFEERKNER